MKVGPPEDFEVALCPLRTSLIAQLVKNLSRESSRPRDRTQVSRIVDRHFTTEPPEKPFILAIGGKKMLWKRMQGLNSSGSKDYHHLRHKEQLCARFANSASGPGRLPYGLRF